MNLLDRLQRHAELTEVWWKSLGMREYIFLGLIVIGWFFPEYYGEQLWVIAACLVSLFVWKLPYALSLRLLLIYHVSSAAYFLAFRDAFRTDIALAIDVASSRVVAFECALIMAALFFARLNIRVLGAVAVLGAVVTVADPEYGGLTFVTTMNTAFLAALLPFVPPFFLPLMLVAVALHKGALAYGIVALHLLVFGIYFKSWRYLGGFLGAVVCGGLWLGRTIPSAPRANFNAITLYDWWTTNIWFGNGLGSFQILGPLLQKANHIDPGEYWLSLHNEWIQALHETGIVGVALLVFVFCDFLWRQRREPILISTMLALGAAGTVYYPFKIPIFALVFAVLTAEGLRICPTKKSELSQTA